MMISIKKILSVFVCVSVLIFANKANAENQAPKEWLDWLDNLKKEMLSRGISEKTIETAYGTNTYYHKRPEVVEKDKNQTEFIFTSVDYVNKLVNKNRVKVARKHYKKLKKKYQTLEEEYNVPLNYLTAFWAIETNFGQNKGKYHLIDGLTNLSYKNRRSKFFKNELYNVLKIMEKFDLKNDKMMGSWAGAMGHFQFMPSTYNAYAIDYDKDGIIDIWDSFDDAIASASNYLNSLGWKKDEPWGLKVSLPWDFDYNKTGYKVTKTLAEWDKMGVRTANGKKIDLNPQLKASIIIPDGRKANTYMVFSNFKRIMIWNRSENYALAVSMLADYTDGNNNYKKITADKRYAITNKDVKKVQAFANKILRTNLKEDGILGPKTKEAVKKLQQKAKLHQDGYPDYRLLLKIERYNPKNGFTVPVQPIKVVKNNQK